MSKFFSAIALSSLAALASPAKADKNASISVLISSNSSAPDQTGPVSKNATRLFKYLENETKTHFVVHSMPWKRALVTAQIGKGFLYGASRNVEREAQLKFSEPIYFETIWLVKRCDNSLKFTQLIDLQEKSIGVVRGASYGDEFDRASNVIFKAELDANNNQARFAKLLRKRTDAMVIYSQAQNTTLLENDINRRYSSLATSEVGDMRTHPFCVFPKPVSTRSIHFAVAPGYNDQFFDRLNAALTKARSSGELAGIYSGALPH